MENQITKGAQPTYPELTTAWNNTYGKGINPEGVPDMLAALKSLLELIDQVSGGFKFPAVSSAKSAIEKATIK